MRHIIQISIDIISCIPAWFLWLWLNRDSKLTVLDHCPRNLIQVWILSPPTRFHPAPTIRHFQFHPVPTTPPIRQFQFHTYRYNISTQYPLLHPPNSFKSTPPSTQHSTHPTVSIISDFKPLPYQICPVETCGVPGVNPDLSIWLSLLQVLQMNSVHWTW